MLGDWEDLKISVFQLEKKHPFDFFEKFSPFQSDRKYEITTENSYENKLNENENKIKFPGRKYGNKSRNKLYTSRYGEKKKRKNEDRFAIDTDKAIKELDWEERKKKLS